MREVRVENFILTNDLRMVQSAEYFNREYISVLEVLIREVSDGK
jgi:hypothetical protein